MPSLAAYKKTATRGEMPADTCACRALQPAARVLHGLPGAAAAVRGRSHGWLAQFQVHVRRPQKAHRCPARTQRCLGPQPRAKDLLRSPAAPHAQGTALLRGFLRWLMRCRGPAGPSRGLPLGGAVKVQVNLREPAAGRASMTEPGASSRVSGVAVAGAEVDQGRVRTRCYGQAWRHWRVPLLLRLFLLLWLPGPHACCRS